MKDRDPFPLTAESALQALGADVAGPMLTGYVFWVLREAAARNLRRLYFVARDGQVMLAIARQIAPRIGLDIELKYLYGSRQAWHLPAVRQVAAGELDWILEKHTVMTPAVVAQRTGLPVAMIVEALRGIGSGVPESDLPLTDEAVLLLGRQLQQDEVLRSALLDEAARRREIALGYFRQEGLLEDVPWGMVDLGWLGNIQNSLRSMLDAGGRRTPMTGFYFGLFKPGTPGNVKMSYFFGPEDHDEYRHVAHSAVQVIEILCSADHGMTTGYGRAADGTYLPQLGKPPGPDQLRKLAALRAGIMRFIQELHLDQKTFDAELWRKGSLAALKVLYGSPTRAEADALGSFRFSRDQTESMVRDLAPRLTLPAAISCLIDYARGRHPRVSDWMHGSRARSGPAVRALFRAAQFIHEQVSRARARFRVSSKVAGEI